MPPEEQTTETVEQTDLSAAAESISEAFQPAASETPDTPEQSGNDEPLQSAWGSTIPAKPEDSETPPEKPETDSATAEDDLIMREFGIPETSREGMKSLRAEFKKLQERNAELEKASGATEKLRAEYEAIDRIRNSSAYASDVMQPQADALREAKSIANDAYIDESAVEDIFRAGSKYEAERLLSELGDETAEKMIRPLVMGALEARQRGTDAIRADDPVAELQEWEQRSRETASRQNQAQLQQEIAIDSAVFRETYQEKIANTAIAQTPFGQKVYNEMISEIEAGTPVSREIVLQGLYEQKLAPVKDHLLTQQAAEIARLNRELERIGGGGARIDPGHSGRTEAGATVVSAWSTG